MWKEIKNKNNKKILLFLNNFLIYLFLIGNNKKIIVINREINEYKNINKYEIWKIKNKVALKLY